MTGVSRRRLFRSAWGIGALASAASVLPPKLQRVMADPVRKTGDLDEIKHVVILMQENRSFDHYFGTMRGVRGFDDPNAAQLPNGRSIFYQPDPGNPSGYLLPFHLDSKTTSAQAIPSTSHAWSTQHRAWNGGAMDNWVPAHRSADGNANGPYTMGYYQRADIPFHFALAESFTICDAYHSSVLGPTWPNRLYHWTGTIDPSGAYGGPVISNVIPQPFRWTTYPERLTEAGISWHVYQGEDDYGCNPLEFFAAYQDAKPGDVLYEHGLTIGPADTFAHDALHDQLPTVSWIIPTPAQSEHPDYFPASGADFLARQLDAVAANPDVWRKTVFIVNYDENDGLFDHAIPPTPPEGTPDEFVEGLPIGAGIRVPCIIISPWTQGGYVSSEPFDHTSVLRFLEQITGVREPNISDWRRQTFGDLTSALGFPHTRPFPALPPTKPHLWAAEHKVATLPLPTVPGTEQSPSHQTFPHQGAGNPLRPVPQTVTATGRPSGTRRLSRLIPSPHGTAGTNFPGTQDAVPKTGPVSGVHVYVACMVSCSIAVLDTSTHQLVASIAVGHNPYGITASVGGPKLYISNSGASAVSVYDTTQGKIVSSVTVGLFPHGVASAPNGQYVYVANTGPDTGSGGSQSISVIDTNSEKVCATWQAGLAPRCLAPSPDGGTLYVTCFDGLAVVDTAHGEPRRLLTGQARSHGVAVHPDGSRIYVANSREDTLSVIDTGSTSLVVARIPVGRTPWQVALSPDGARVYVTGAGDNTVTVIDAARGTVLGTVRVHHVPTGITATDDTVWVSTNAASTVEAIDAKTLQVRSSTSLGLSSEPSGLVVF
ncbi:MAG: beta-propeller fold lactonase family protein [Streptomycetaceae bacterium]|nr:beta-propeller fold lactonase family protein [Streptomycetaceae bacterium]